MAGKFKTKKNCTENCLEKIVSVEKKKMARKIKTMKQNNPQMKNN